MPIGRLTELFHSYGIPIIVDGAHALGNIPLDLGDPTGELANVDFWFGACCYVEGAVVPRDTLRAHTRARTHATPLELDTYLSDQNIWRSPFSRPVSAIDGFVLAQRAVHHPL